jgi:PAP2 superfamily protein
VARLPWIDHEYTLSQVELGRGYAPALPRRLRLPSARTLAAVAALAAAAAAVTWADGLDWTPDRVLLVFLAPALVLRRTRRYLVDFVPFALLILLYAECRGLAHIASPHPFYRPQLWLERHLFGGVPAEWLQARFWHGSMQWYDALAAKVLKLHFVVPPLVAFALWMRSRMLFYRFATSMIVLSFASAVVFFVFPSAPPWAAAQAGLLKVVKLPPVNDVSSLGSATHAPANPYAAIPSLHAGYAFLVSLTVGGLILGSRLRLRRVLAGLCFLYPLAESVAVIYTGNHYVVDIVVGCAFATGAYLVTNRTFTRATTFTSV